MTAEDTPTDTIAGGWKAWRERAKSGQRTHGMGPSRYLPGDVQHLVSPLVGMLRLMEHNCEAPAAEDVEYLIDRLSFVLDIAREADSSPQADALVASDPQGVLDALTRAGVLTEQAQVRPIWGERPRAGTESGLILPETPKVFIERWAPVRRLVTAWREVQS